MRPKGGSTSTQLINPTNFETLNTCEGNMGSFSAQLIKGPERGQDIHDCQITHLRPTNFRLPERAIQSFVPVSCVHVLLHTQPASHQVLDRRLHSNLNRQ